MDYFSCAAGIARLFNRSYDDDELFPGQERRGIEPIPEDERELMRHYERDRQRESEGVDLYDYRRDEDSDEEV